MKIATIGMLSAMLGLMVGCVAPEPRVSAAPQKTLEDRVMDLEKTNTALEKENEALKGQFEAQRARLAALENAAFPPETSVLIMGQVLMPGRFKVDDKVEYTLEELVQAAGGFTRLAVVRRVKLTRQDKATGARTTTTVDLSNEGLAKGNGKLKLQPGDIVYVMEWID